MPRPVGARQSLRINLPLQSHERVQQRLRTRRASGDMHVNRNIAVNSLQHVIPLLEWAARDRARAHRDHVLGLRHLVIEPHHLRSHLLRHRTRDDHQVCLTRRRPEDLRAEPGNVIPRHRCRDHLNRATSQTKRHRPHRTSPAPVVELFQGRGNDSLLAQLDLQLLVHCETIPFSVLVKGPRDASVLSSYQTQFKTPFCHAHTKPSTSRSKNTIIAIDAPTVRPVNATANGNKKIVSTSKIRKMIA